MKIWPSVQFSSVQLLSHVRLFATPWTAAHQASLSITSCRNLLKLSSSIESVMPPTISSSVIPFSFCLQTFPASGSFIHVYLSTIWLNCWEGVGCHKKSIFLDDKHAPPQHLCLSPPFHSSMSSAWPLETSELWLRRKHRCFDYQQKPAVFLPKIMFSLWKD